MLSDFEQWISVPIAALTAVAVGLLRIEDGLARYLRYWAPGQLRRLRLGTSGSHVVIGAVGAVIAIQASWFPSDDSALLYLNGVVYGIGAAALFRADVSSFTLSGATSTRSLYQLFESVQRKHSQSASQTNLVALIKGAKPERLIAVAFEILAKNYSIDTKPKLGAKEIAEGLHYASTIFDGDLEKIDPPLTTSLAAATAQHRAWVERFVVLEIAKHEITFEEDSTWAETKTVWSAD